MRNVKNLALFVLMLALVSTAAVADTHYVVPGESIQAAIDAADPGDEIEVASGTYTEAIDFIGKAVRLYSSGTILEGFTITGGDATGSGWDSSGGGMYNYYSSPMVTNCTFTGNTADYGGGGMFNIESESTVTNCTFSSNTADSSGGGMHNLGSHPTVTDCTFTDNTTVWDGGGMDNYSSSPTVTNCTFNGNTSYARGGGMGNVNSSSPTVTNCTFTGNTAYNSGGGMGNLDNASPTVTNCTFSSNTADSSGGGMFNSNNSNPTVTNCILWSDSPNEIFEDNSSTTVTYSNVQGGTGQIWFGEGCIDTDPMFADSEGRLSFGSPCIDAGNDFDVPPSVTTDLDGNPRIQGVCVDMGAFESDFIVDLSGWVYMEGGTDFGYSLEEDDFVYFFSPAPVLAYNVTTGQWLEPEFAGMFYVDWPFLYELDTGDLWYALPLIEFWVYHFSTGVWELLPRIIPW